MPWLLALFIGLLAPACEEEEAPIVDEEPPGTLCDTTFNINHSYDTIYPSDYLMTYPESWWTFDDGQTYVCNEWLHVRIMDTVVNDSCVIVNEDMLVLPNSYLGSVAGTMANGYPMVGGSAGEEIFYRASSTALEPPVTQYSTLRVRCEATYDSMAVLGNMYHDVICMQRIRTVAFGPDAVPSLIWLDEYFFANGVGIIRHRHNHLETWVFDRKLTAHHIAPH